MTDVVAADAAPGSPTPGLFETLRASEFARLDRRGEAYLDYTGSALHAESCVARHAEMLREQVLGNPHSDSPTSRASSAYIEQARARTLRFFDADPEEYVVCFTPNASVASKLVGEAYPFELGSRLVLSADNHNSVNGLREFARARGAGVTYVPLDGELRLTEVETALGEARGRRRRTRTKLFAFPAQSNFSGVRHSLELVGVARELGHHVLLDAASYVPSNALSLREVAADFVCVSFYKMFGYPTGVGALIARREALERLRRPWFAGGTVDFVSVQHGTHLLKVGPEAFEDGTPNFVSLAAVAVGFDLLERVGMSRLAGHVRRLTTTLLEELGALRHANGRPVVRIYGPAGMESRGGTVAFNVLDADGTIVPYGLVESRAREARVSVRGGCFCNPGAAERAFDFAARDAGRCLSVARVSGRFDLQRFTHCMSPRPAGAVRMSVGLATNDVDLKRGIEVVATWRE